MKNSPSTFDCFGNSQFEKKERIKVRLRNISFSIVLNDKYTIKRNYFDFHIQTKKNALQKKIAGHLELFIVLNYTTP
jgi:hypothetical protein